jgi:hypothetical protein
MDGCAASWGRLRFPHDFYAREMVRALISGGLRDASSQKYVYRTI